MFVVSEIQFRKYRWNLLSTQFWSNTLKVIPISRNFCIEIYIHPLPFRRAASAIFQTARTIYFSVFSKFKHCCSNHNNVIAAERTEVWTLWCNNVFLYLWHRPDTVFVHQSDCYVTKMTISFSVHVDASFGIGLCLLSHVKTMSTVGGDKNLITTDKSLLWYPTLMIKTKRYYTSNKRTIFFLTRKMCVCVCVYAVSYTHLLL